MGARPARTWTSSRRADGDVDDCMSALVSLPFFLVRVLDGEHKVNWYTIAELPTDPVHLLETKSR